MAKFIRSLAAIIALLIFTALFEPPIMAKFAEWGWHDRPEQIAGDVVNWVVRLFGEAAFPWIAAGGLGLGAGVWLHWIASRLDDKRPSKTERFSGLSNLISNVKREIIDSVKTANGEPDFRTRDRPSELRLVALYSELKLLGLRPPNYDNYPNDQYVVSHYRYLETLEPFASIGNLAEAKRQEKLVKARIKSLILEPS